MNPTAKEIDAGDNQAEGFAFPETEARPEGHSNPVAGRDSAVQGKHRVTESGSRPA